MRKTLVALTVLATTASAFADDGLSLNGKFGAGVQRTTASGNKGHLGITDGELTFAGSETLDGGLKAQFSLTTDFFRWKGKTEEKDLGGGNTRTVPVASGDRTVGETGDVFLLLAGSFGAVKFGEWESLSSAWVIGNVAPISTPVDLYESGRLLQPSNRATRIAYSTPTMGGLQGTLLLSDRTVNGDKVLNGSEGSATLGFTFTQEALKVGFSAKNVNVKDFQTYQLGASYDLGIVTLGAGVDQMGKLLLGGERLGYLLSAAAPVGPVTLGATYLQSSIDGIGGAAKRNAQGYALGAEYALSKRTALNASVAKFEDDAFKNDADFSQGQYRMKLVHSF